MYLKKLYPIIICLISISMNILGQEKDIYSLLTEKYVDRPLAMHKGQLQVNTGYEFSIINKAFDVDGGQIDLATDGSVFSKHLFPFDIRLGILEYVQFNASTNYGSMGIRSQIDWMISLDTFFLSKELYSYKGFDDLYLGLDLTVPFPSDFPVNWIFAGGIHLPVFGHEPDKPSHSIQVLEPLILQAEGTALQFNPKFGSGVPFINFGTGIKYRLRQFSFIGSFNYKTGLNEGKSITWRSRYRNGEFEYVSSPYEYRVSNVMVFYGEVAWQAINWFAVTAYYSGFKNSGGWSGISGQKVALYDESLHSIGLGYEIQVSPSLRFNQQTVLPFNGKNIMAPWIFNIGISFNFISSRYN